MPLGHIRPPSASATTVSYSSAWFQPFAFMTANSRFKPAEGCWSTFRPPRVHPWDRKFGSEKAPPNNQKEGSLPLGHIRSPSASATTVSYSSAWFQPFAFMTANSSFKPAEGCWSTFRPPRVHPWDRKFGSETAPAITKKKARCPLVTPPFTFVANRTQHQATRQGSVQSRPCCYWIPRKISSAG